MKEFIENMVEFNEDDCKTIIKNAQEMLEMRRSFKKQKMN